MNTEMKAPRLQPIDASTATREQLQLLASVKQVMGGVPNLIATMAHSPAVAGAYLAFSQALSKGVLSAKAREQIILAVSQANECEYCLAAHTMLADKAGLTPEEILAARRAEAGDAKMTAALGFALRLAENRGQVDDAEITALRAAGLNDAEIAEVAANTVLSLFTNYFNHVAGTAVDFPAAPRLQTCACA